MGRADAADNVQRWEYLTLSYNRAYGRTDYYVNSAKQTRFKNLPLAQVLNTIGMQGWEMVGMGGAKGQDFAFKRPRTGRAGAAES